MRGEHHNMIDYDKIASEYAQHRKVHPEVLKNLFLTSGIRTDSKVLEVGCGTGNYIIALESIANCSCWGTDPSEQMLSKAKKRSEKIAFQLGRAERLDFPKDFFDLVFSVDVIHHTSNPIEYFQEAYQVLKRGKKLCTVTDSEWIIRHRQPLAVYFPEEQKKIWDEMTKYGASTAFPYVKIDGEVVVGYNPKKYEKLLKE